MLSCCVRLALGHAQHLTCVCVHATQAEKSSKEQQATFMEQAKAMVRRVLAACADVQSLKELVSIILCHTQAASAWRSLTAASLLTVHSDHSHLRSHIWSHKPGMHADGEALYMVIDRVGVRRGPKAVQCAFWGAGGRAGRHEGPAAAAVQGRQ